jgi:WhiB family transcriptional regulator, redox-sensing transcriptional regulator
MSRPEQPWRAHAVCIDLDPNIFFPPSMRDLKDAGVPDASKVQNRLIKEAKKVCWEQCPVRSHCLEFALDSHETIGIFGGATGNERRRILSRRRLAARLLEVAA